eukprot:TRINITY_DN82922_c0_g4_i1.p1 TRINITY_DN82922_c0_g4~~TRINITY_DN82922_c0_g4_i1.p1  ORF type:complete len:489 (+),score=151.16 TRINITY_DN82922_c0_g4_i1:119-1585(+)
MPFLQRIFTAMMFKSPDREISSSNNFLEAVRSGDLDRAKALQQKGGPMILNKRLGRLTAVHIACDKGFDDILAWLLEIGASINDITPKQQTALHLAALAGSLKCMKLLIATGHDIECTDRDDKTPLMFAALSGSTDCVVFLLKHGASSTAMDKSGFNALHYGAKSANVEVVQAMNNLSVNVNATTSTGESALHIAVRERQWMSVRFLKTLVDRNIRNESGQTALDLAIAQRFSLGKSELRAREESFINQLQPKGPLIGFPLLLAILWYTLPSGFAASFLGQFFVILVVLSVPFFLLLCKSKSGVILPNRSDYETAIDELGFNGHLSSKDCRLCHFCQTVGPVRSKHCHSCKCCVPALEMHHHVFDNCIGQNNFGIFLAFLIIVFLMSWCHFLIIFFGEGYLAFWLTPSMAFCGGMTWVAGLEVFLLFNNVYAEEVIHLRNLPYFQDNASFVNPFDKGSIMANLKARLFQPKFDNERFVRDYREKRTLI